mgnify:FL=1
MRIVKIQSDYLGVISGTLCMVHCALTPLLFLTQTHLINISFLTPSSWKSFNYLFLTISAVAEYQSIQNSTSLLIKRLLVLAWIILSMLILNELFEVSHIAEAFTYIAAASLCGLHVYNLKYCQCDDEDCCIQ